MGSYENALSLFIRMSVSAKTFPMVVLNIGFCYKCREVKNRYIR